MALPLPFDTQGLPVVNAIIQGAGGGVIQVGALAESNPAPDPSSVLGTATTSLRAEPDGALKTAALARTDAGSFADDFHTEEFFVPLVGVSQFTFGSKAVVGTITSYLTELREGDYVYLAADTYIAAAQIASIDDNTHLTLETFYLGAGGAAGVARMQNHRVDLVGAAALGVTDSLAELTPGAGAGDSVTVRRAIGAGGRKGYAPQRGIWYASLDLRTGDQEAQLGFIGINPYTGAVIQGTEAVFFFDGLVDTIVTCRTRSSTSAFDTWDEDVTLPAGGVTAVKHHYEILYYPDRAEFFIDNVRVAIHPRHLPDPYVPLAQIEQIVNIDAEPVEAAFIFDWVGYANLADVRVEVSQPEAGKLRMTPVTPSAPGASVSVAVDSDAAHVITATTQLGYRYRVSVVGGEGLCIRCDGTAPLVSNEPWYTYQKFEFIAVIGTNTVRAIKRTAGTMDGTIIVTALDGGYIS
jgi:hypothetical protein